MLIISSNLHQSIVVGELEGLESMLKVTVLGVRGTKVRLGFEVVPGDRDCPSEVGDRQSDASPALPANQGMESTQVWDWPEEDDVEVNPQTSQ